MTTSTSTSTVENALKNQLSKAVDYYFDRQYTRSLEQQERDAARREALATKIAKNIITTDSKQQVFTLDSFEDKVEFVSDINYINKQIHDLPYTFTVSSRRLDNFDYRAMVDIKGRSRRAPQKRPRQAPREVLYGTLASSTTGSSSGSSSSSSDDENPRYRSSSNSDIDMSCDCNDCINRDESQTYYLRDNNDSDSSSSSTSTTKDIEDYRPKKMRRLL